MAHFVGEIERWITAIVQHIDVNAMRHPQNPVFRHDESDLDIARLNLTHLRNAMREHM